MQYIPIDIKTNENSVRFNCSLEGTDFQFRLDWSARSACWYISIYQEDEPIITGRRLSADFPLLTGVCGVSRPKGELQAKDTTGRGVDPGHDDLGGGEATPQRRVQLMYWTAQEVADAASS